MCIRDRSHGMPFLYQGEITATFFAIAEIFSISPSNEHLNWAVHTNSETDIPGLQAKTARWLKYLNT